MASADWIEWTGGECPVAGDACVQIKTADNNPSWQCPEGHSAVIFSIGRNLWTGKGCHDQRITAYRVVQS